MKVLVFSPYYPPHTGGLETHSQEWNEHLAAHGFEITTFTSHLPLHAPSEEKFSHQIVFRYPVFEIISNFPIPCFWKKGFWKPFSQLSDHRPDVVITRTRFFLSSLLGALYAKWYKIPHLHIEHGSEFVILSSPITTFLARLYDETLGRLVFALSTENIAISEAVSNFIRRFDTRETPLIYRGLNFHELDDAPTIPKENGKIRLVTAARLYKWKGIEKTLEALRNLPENLLSQLEFYVIGDGEDRINLEKKSEGLPVIFTGRKSRLETFSFLRSADIYVHSSYPGGGLSTSLLEALYAQCAVIATPNEGAREVIQNDENGILTSHEQLSQSLLHLLKSPEEREKFSSRARESVVQRFSWQESSEKYKVILEKYDRLS